jgi:hypothetical protein
MVPQVVLTIEGQEIIDNETGVSYGYNIPRSQVTNLTFRNNTLISVNSAGYILQAGDEVPGLNNNHLDGAVITGNRFTWNGTDAESWTHAMFTGYNLGVKIKYNYLTNTPNGIQRKSNGMTDATGVVAYNIVKNPKVGIVVKGMNGVRIYNNTLYCEKTTTETGRGLIDIHTNTDNGLNAPSTGVKVYNNIFYTKFQTYCINVMDNESLVDFQSDYNIFYCETGSPVFNAGGVPKTFTEWQGMGYDLHSVILNPTFNNFNDFVPAERLDYGTNLGEEFQVGLAVDAIWGTTDPKTVNQNGIWQVGARIFMEEVNGEEELPQNMTKVYPSPASGHFFILLTDTSRIYQSLTLYDSAGRILLKGPLEYGLNRIQIPASFSSGLYNLVLESEELDRYIRKIILLN